MYRLYQSHIPLYLHNRPRSVIVHCLDRKTNSCKILPEQVHDIDTVVGVFEIEKASGRKHTVDFGTEDPNHMPSCTCKDWLRHHIPCKHFFSIFTHRNDWGWDKLPESYLKSAYLSTDVQALNDFFHSQDEADLSTSVPMETDDTNVECGISQQLQIPVRKLKVLRDY